MGAPEFFPEVRVAVCAAHRFSAPLHRSASSRAQSPKSLANIACSSELSVSCASQGSEVFYSLVQLGIIVVIRTVIDYFLGREINELGGTDA